MAVVGVGIDVVDVDRFGESLDRTPGLRERLFTAGRGDAPAGLAGRPVRRQGGVAKALGAPAGMAWHDAEVVSEASGRPVLEDPRLGAGPRRRARRLLGPPVALARRRDRLRRGGAGADEARAHGRAGAGGRGAADGGAARGRADAARGAGLAYAVLDLLGAAYGRRVLLLVGPGNNGGDALYAGALLARRGCASRRGCWRTGCTRPGLAALRGAGGRVVSSALSSTRPDVVVDGIVGIGGRPGLRPTPWPRSRPCGACRSSRSTCPPASTSTPASSTART